MPTLEALSLNPSDVREWAEAKNKIDRPSHQGKKRDNFNSVSK